MTTRPTSRDEFEIAIVCASPLEYDAVSLLIDQFWDEDGDPYGRAAGDPNMYTTGRIGNFDVVLALLPNLGKASAASAAASLRASYPGLRLALLTGICGGVPIQVTDDDMLLGDVVISKTVVQYDLGNQFPDGFVTKDTGRDSLGRPTKNIRNLLAVFETELARERLERRTAYFLEKIQNSAPRNSTTRRRRRPDYQYPGAVNDRLFQATYRHKHHISPRCLCAKCHESSDSVCEESRQLSCDELGCDPEYVVGRKRLETNRLLECEGREKEAQPPAIFIGCVGSGDAVVKSGEDRDRIAKCHGIMAFEMEGAGVWDEVPCIVVKGVCDYADSHKNKRWQNFAAATAASAAKALLERYIQADRPSRDRSSDASQPFLPDPDFVNRPDIIQRMTEKYAQPAAPFARFSPAKLCSTLPFEVDPDFVNRPDILSWIEKKFKGQTGRIALVGLGGIGKSQIAIHFAHQIRKSQPDTRVFWVYASTKPRFEEAYRSIARVLGLPGINDPNVDVLGLVRDWLQNEQNGNWLMILDNADDVGILYPKSDTKVSGYIPSHCSITNDAMAYVSPLASFLPKTRNGNILITSRSIDAAERLTGSYKNVFKVPAMSEDQAAELFRKKRNEVRDDEGTPRFAPST